MAITPQPGYKVDPNNPNGVIPIAGGPANPSAVPTPGPTLGTNAPPPVTTPGTPATPAQAAKPQPTAVVSSEQGQALYDSATNTITQAQTAQQQAAATKIANQGKPGYDQYGNPVSGTPLSTGGAAAPTIPTTINTSTQTPEEAFLAQPDAGMQFVWDTSGNQQQIAVGSTVPTGYTTVNPTTGPSLPVTSSVSLPSGATIKQFSDGTYGIYAAQTGAYMGTTTAQNFQTAQSAQQALNSYNQVLNGSYPLTASQQAQITALQSQYATLIQNQTTMNANVVGVTTNQQNLFGMGGSSTGLGIIQNAITEGVNKITDLQNKLASAVATMTAADNTDNLNQLKDAYTAFTTANDELQKSIDTLQSEQTAQLKTLATDQASNNDAMAKKYPDTITPILPSDTPDQVQQKLQTSPSYTSNIQAAAGLNADQSQFWAALTSSPGGADFNFPARISVNVKTQLMQTMADDASALGLSGADVGQALVDTNAKADMVKTVQGQITDAQANETTAESNFADVVTNAKKVGDENLQTAIPLLNQILSGVQMKATDNPDLTNFITSLQTALESYAATIGGTAGATAENDAVQHFVNNGLNEETIQSFIDTVAKPTMENTITGLQTANSSLFSALNVANGTQSIASTESSLAGIGTSATATSTPVTSGATTTGTSAVGGWGWSPSQ